MSKKINVNPDFYKVGGREHSEGSDKGRSYERRKQEFVRVLPGAKTSARPVTKKK
ncbi:MAG TPA: hypothetical protein VNL91_07110 [Thermoanaerobaculia bacterium]|nr:hypothetical protein [Thermoanaerobaculia bacterium]